MFERVCPESVAQIPELKIGSCTKKCFETLASPNGKTDYDELILSYTLCEKSKPCSESNHFSPSLPGADRGCHPPIGGFTPKIPGMSIQPRAIRPSAQYYAEAGLEFAVDRLDAAFAEQGMLG
jgi:hypothetical protein